MVILPRAIRLKCEYTVNPLGIDVIKPRLSWIIEGDRNGILQNAYQIVAASSQEKLNSGNMDLWDSGKVNSHENLHIPYGGRRLISSQKVYWKVRIWDEENNISCWSDTAYWVMGQLSDEDWRASWISVPTDMIYETLLVRKDFDVRSGILRAILHVSGLGQYEATINGDKISNDIFCPGWTKYDKTCLYDTYDITHFLSVNKNTIGIFLGNGIYNIHGGRYSKFIGSFGSIKVIAQIKIEYKDGSIDIVGTDSSWKAFPGPITFSCFYGGEDYDARLFPEYWDTPYFNPNKWKFVTETKGPGGKLRGKSISAPPIGRIETIKPVQISQLRPDLFVYDMGQNAAIIPKLTVRGPRGSVVKITPAELLKNNGLVDRKSCAHGAADAYWKYTLVGVGDEEYFSKFFYHGARYLQVEIAAPYGSALPCIESLEAVVVHSTATSIGEFSSSSALFNRIHNIIRWSQRSNLMHVVTDCPHREKLGWLEQYHLNGPSLRYEFDTIKLFAKCVNDMADSQLENGLVPNIAPEYTVFSGSFRDSPEWGSAIILVPWQQYEWTGDLEILNNYYEPMKRYMAYLRRSSKNYILSRGLGDWYDRGLNSPGKAQLTPKSLTATAFYYQNAVILSKVALLMDNINDNKYFSDLAVKIRKAFNRKFFDSGKYSYATGSQCANAVSLAMGLVEEEYRERVLDAIIQDVFRHNNSITTGDIGYRYLLRALALNDRNDVIFDLNNQSDRPGYGYQLNLGATTLCESWDANPRSSQNHFMLGQIIEWFYRDLAGISFDADIPGFKKIIIKPNIAGNLTHVRASYETLYGKIIISWRLRNDKFNLDVRIPPNTTAVVYVPSFDVSVKSRSGYLGDDKNIRLVACLPERTVFEIGSGYYNFESMIV